MWLADCDPQMFSLPIGRAGKVNERVVMQYLKFASSVNPVWSNWLHTCRRLRQFDGNEQSAYLGDFFYLIFVVCVQHSRL